ncbi:MAG TPA: hypothetical protein VLQ47_04560 [Rhodoferax sp.]|nr:hypothetical protein [Rhodoferax sp.]
MKVFFSLVNFVVGILALMIGFGNFLFLAHHPSSTIAGLAAMAVGATCLWLASKSILSSQQPG